MVFGTEHRAFFTGIAFAVAACGVTGGVSLTSTGSAKAQELTVYELLPGRRQLAPTETEVTVDSLRFSAKEAIGRWNALMNNPDQQTYDGFFEIFREVARIESLERASQLAGVGLENELAAAAAEIHADFLKHNLTASDAGKAALSVLIGSDRSLFNDDKIERLKISYALILDYLGDIEAGRLAIVLARRFAEENRMDMALETYTDYVPYYFGLLKTDAEREELIGLAAENATHLKSYTTLRVLGEVLSNAPRDEKVTLAQRVFSELDPDYLSSMLDGVEGVHRTSVEAWSHAQEIASGAQPSVPSADLLATASNTANFVAVELVYTAQPDMNLRNAQLLASLRDDLSTGRALIAFQKLLNLPVSAVDALPVYLSLIETFAGHGYATYVAKLSEELAQAASTGEINLDDKQLERLFTALEVLPEPDMIDGIASAIPGAETRISRTKLRATIFSAFDSPVEKPVGADPIFVPENANAALAAAATLFNGKLVNGEVGDLAAKDLNLLSKVTEFLWNHESRRDLLVNYVASDTDAFLRQVVALGITANPAFDVTETHGSELAKIIAGMLPELEPSPLRDMLGASIGIIEEDTVPRGLTLARYARYLAASGNRLDPGVAQTVAERGGILEANAVFDGASHITETLKQIPNYRERVSAFRRLAIARADVLDRKGWLNSATHVTESDPVTPSFGPTVKDAGQLTLKTSPIDDAFGTNVPFMPNLLMGEGSITSKVPVIDSRNFAGATASIAARGETRATRLVRFPSEHYDGLINLGVREHVFLNTRSSTQRIIFVALGTVTASELVSQIQASDPDAISLKDGIVTLNVPLAVKEGATLILSGLDIKEFRFNTNKGAFLVNSGTLYLDGVTVSSFDEATGKPSFVWDGGKKPKFRPFLLSWSNSQTFATSTEFVALGYAGGRTYGLSLSAGPSDAVSRRLHTKLPTGTFINNSFNNLFYGFYTYDAKDIVFVGNELVNGVIYGLDPHDWSHNLMMAYNVAYGTQKKHGIIISREVDDSYIVGNLSFENTGTGIMLDRLSYGTVVFANDSSHNEGDGFAAMESPCVLVDSNYFVGNHRAGVKVRNSWDVHVANNIVANNRAAGIEAYIDNLRAADASEFRDFEKDPFLPVATMSAIGNEVRNNALGISIRGATETTYFKNRFVNQAPKYAGGDIKPVALDIVSRSMKGGVQVRSTCIPKITIEKSCSLYRSGVIHSHMAETGTPGSDVTGNFCVDVAGTPQATSFTGEFVE
ncbi:Poly(beta-D-mannuronate) C5 epimerase precursor [Roseibium album]|nr:Poly(beta-D-mannuronate) C5 epimerase precursor [Roseibium album]